MQFVVVFGISYYVIEGVMPEYAFHRMNFLTGKFGDNLDATGPFWARHRANFLLKKYGSLNA